MRCTSLPPLAWLLLPVLALGGAAGCIGTDLVDDPPTEALPAQIVLTPASRALLTGETTALTATYYGVTGEATPGVAFSWSSSAPEVATVDDQGTVSALLPGQARIQATTSDAVSNAAILTVVADPTQVAQVVVMPDTTRLERDATHVFTAVALNLNGQPVDGSAFTWASADPAVATIDGAGRAEALMPGVTEITATTAGVASAPAVLFVLGQRRTGTFRKRAGTSYELSGSATLEEQSNGSLLLSFGADFSTSNGPGLEVYLSTTSSVGTNSISLGALQRTTGAQTYGVPSGVALTTYKWVIIHCVPFNVTFGAAQLN